MVIDSKDLLHGIIVNNNEITSPNEEKLLGILLDSKLNFESYIGPLFWKKGQKINAIARLRKLPYSDQSNLLLNFFIRSQFPYCPLISIVTFQCLKNALKSQSCKLYNSKCMKAIKKITNIEVFSFIAVLVF